MFVFSLFIRKRIRRVLFSLRPIHAVAWIVLAHVDPDCIAHFELCLFVREEEIWDEQLDCRALLALEQDALFCRFRPERIQLGAEIFDSRFLAEVISELFYICIDNIVRILEPAESHHSFTSLLMPVVMLLLLTAWYIDTAKKSSD